ncbi:MAG: hypothetical protein R3B65_01525 [Candidatus Paceibacterota bacterium]
MVSITKDDVTQWTLDNDGGSDETAGTSWSITGSGSNLSSDFGGDVILVGTAINTDSYSYNSHALSASE